MISVLDTAGLEPGFANPVFDSQDTFRRVLDAYAYVGRPQTLVSATAAVGPLDPATAAVCLTLADCETPVWLDSRSNLPSVRKYLGFHCGVPFVDSVERSTFAIVANPMTMPRLAEFNPGTELEPQVSTTIVVQVPSLNGGPPVRWRGPGIQREVSVDVDGLASWFWEDWELNHELYPSGVDVLFTSGNAIIALPRSISGEI
ncbi:MULTISPECIES: phosphonate C-P lyase system protein PhnH [Mesorhizobium]|uniref:Phosphonate C-P lyase system protein PhnH n=4 Tax=Mesorhizobium TaxID=68287 RepID=A0ABZ0VKJ3_9HYPH|nr:MULTISPECIES: phosphonate C-P lyase system protein PhnH [Mesorhizobium]MBZ9909454.1 phosphonate C-P lyase system protein PhnH [Mesorhizobium sp. BR115XR7A]QGX80700.1 phosphonate C-P lyase system protein PhnH [Mesorhizobium japonicum R7A]QJF04849.1 phosphonate C-P lyase system protein PhnH [Mesorhizobium japonicum R7A]QJF10918.1 phosphonate C-P lyase system protein PhnH [Mesorhizobium japonicum]QJI86791.1 phosphonate C-P lyase system protein PhnH [Mesorhizobium japonicum]